MLAFKLDITPIVDVVINLSAKAAARKGFNLGLIIGPSTVISTQERVRVYTNADQLIQDGFADNSPEYEAALLYFSASTKPKRLAVGRFDESTDLTRLTALKACRAANSEWWPFVLLGASEGDIKDAAMWAEAATPDSMHMYTTSSEKELDSTGDTESVFKYLKDRKTVNYDIRRKIVYALCIAEFILVIVSQFTNLYYYVDSRNFYNRGSYVLHAVCID